MLFLRSTLLLGLGILVLPTDADTQARFYNGAKTAVVWTSTFCDRNADTCTQGGQAWAMFKKKAEFGAKMAIDLMGERAAHTPALTADAPKTATVPAKISQPVAQPMSPRGTLKATDLEPAWRGKTARANG
jgi:Family of unknown function (DUF5330)